MEGQWGRALAIVKEIREARRSLGEELDKESCVEVAWAQPTKKFCILLSGHWGRVLEIGGSESQRCEMENSTEEEASHCA